MRLVIFSILILLSLILRTTTIYFTARALTINKRNILVKSAAIGVFGGLLASLMIFVPLGGLLIFALDYALIKSFFKLNTFISFMIVLGAGLVSEIALFLILNLFSFF